MKTAISLALFAAIALGGCSTPEQTATPAPTVTVTATPTPTGPTLDELLDDAKTETVTKSDFDIEFETVELECFGSAGCLFVVEPVLSADFDSLPDTGTVDIRFKVIGGDEPQIDTIEADLDSGDFYYTNLVIGTPGDRKPSARIISVRYNNDSNSDWL